VSDAPTRSADRHGRLRRRVGGALVAGGLLLVTFASTRYAEGAVRADRVREQWEVQRAHAAVARIRQGSVEQYGTSGVEPGAPVARLRIPRLGLDEIVVEGVGVAELNVGPGHLPGSVLPGETGNAIISAHRDRHFLELGRLAIGDTVTTEVGPHETRWVVVSRRVVGAGAPALFETGEPTLTLTTCWPIRFFGPAPDRLIVTARPTSVPQAARRA
jgi:sortase A